MDNDVCKDSPGRSILKFFFFFCIKFSELKVVVLNSIQVQAFFCFDPSRIIMISFGFTVFWYH